MIQNLLQGFKEIIFPDNCFLCKEYLGPSHQNTLCQSCLSLIKMNYPPFCLTCSRHVLIFNDRGLCPSCLTTNYHFDAAWSACLYEEPLTDLIHSFKYHGKTHLRRSFAKLIIEFIDNYHVPIHNFDVITPIPIHSTRHRERGFNQSQLLSQMICDHYEIPHSNDLISRIKFTETQTKLDAKQRWTNVEGAFRINHSLKIADKSILIVDDLLTTAATANAASQSLKDAGAAYVGVLTLAITP